MTAIKIVGTVIGTMGAIAFGVTLAGALLLLFLYEKVIGDDE